MFSRNTARVASIAMARRTAVAARRPLSAAAVDWSKVASRMVTDESRAELSQLRSVVADVERTVNTTPKVAPSIDWDAWRGKIRHPGVVDEFKRAYETMKWPSCRDETASADAAEFDKLIAAGRVVAEESRKRIAELEQLLADTEKERARVSNVTATDLLQKNPKWKAELQEQMHKDQW